MKYHGSYLSPPARRSTSHSGFADYHNWMVPFSTNNSTQTPRLYTACMQANIVSHSTAQKSITSQSQASHGELFGYILCYESLYHLSQSNFDWFWKVKAISTGLALNCLKVVFVRDTGVFVLNVLLRFYPVFNLISVIIWQQFAYSWSIGD